MNKIFSRFLGVAAVAGAALAVAAPAVADTGKEPAVVDHEDGGERQPVILNDVNQDQVDIHSPFDVVRDTVADLPTPSSGVLGPVGETQPGFAVMSEEGREEIED
ncbi:hypothetical protein [Streptomyces sp. NPDC017520]|uniref:hypothetical protein n=1 Tax=Streptomyces sp. NPDC017520 TaxID=3364998 RepID=UPI0037AADC11